MLSSLAREVTSFVPGYRIPHSYMYEREYTLLPFPSLTFRIWCRKHLEKDRNRVTRRRRLCWRIIVVCRQKLGIEATINISLHHLHALHTQQAMVRLRRHSKEIAEQVSYLGSPLLVAIQIPVS